MQERTRKMYRNKERMKVHQATLLRNMAKIHVRLDYICYMTHFATGVVQFSLSLFSAMFRSSVAWCALLPSFFIFNLLFYNFLFFGLLESNYDIGAMKNTVICFFFIVKIFSSAENGRKFLHENNYTMKIFRTNIQIEHASDERVYC